MEDGLVLKSAILLVKSDNKVLILVVVEDGLVLTIMKGTKNTVES